MMKRYIILINVPNKRIKTNKEFKMKKISEFAERNIRFNTTELLYWMARAAQDIKNGDANAANAAFLNVLQYNHILANTQVRMEDMEQPDWEEIYLACLNSANERMLKGDVND